MTCILPVLLFFGLQNYIVQTQYSSYTYQLPECPQRSYVDKNVKDATILNTNMPKSVLSIC